MKRFRNITILHNQSLNRVNTAEKFIVKGAVRSCRRDVIPKRYGYSPDRNFDSLYFISDNCGPTNTIMPVPIHSSAAFLRQHLRRSWTSNFIKQKVVLKRNS